MTSLTLRYRFTIPAIAIALGALALRLPSLYEPRWYRDEGIFAAIAASVRGGDALYGESWDNKPPGIFLTYAGIQTAFGSGMFALHAVTLAVVLVTLALVMALCWRHGQERGALVGGLLFAALLCTPVLEGNLALTETYMIAFTSAAALAVSTGIARQDDRLLCVAGVLCAIAIGYKQVAVFDAAAFGLLIGLTRRAWLRPTALFVAGIAGPHAFGAVFFLATGTFGDYWYAIAGSMPLYSGLGPDRTPLLRALAVAPAIVAAGALIVRRRKGEELSDRDLPTLWLAFAFAGATSSTMPFAHYLQQVVPPLSLVAAAFAAGMRPSALGAGLAAGATVVAAVQFGPAMLEQRQLRPVPYYENYLSYTFGDRGYQDYVRFFDGAPESVHDIEAAIDEDGAGETLFSWSELAWLYAAGDYGNPTRYYTSFLGSVVPSAEDEVLSVLEKQPPAYIVVSDGSHEPFPELEAWMRGRYLLLRSQNDWRLYRSAELTGRLEPEPQAPQGSTR